MKTKLQHKSYGKALQEYLNKINKYLRICMEMNLRYSRLSFISLLLSNNFCFFYGAYLDLLLAPELQFPFLLFFFNNFITTFYFYLCFSFRFSLHFVFFLIFFANSSNRRRKASLVNRAVSQSIGQSVVPHSLDYLAVIHFSFLSCILLLPYY